MDLHNASFSLIRQAAAHGMMTDELLSELWETVAQARTNRAVEMHHEWEDNAPMLASAAQAELNSKWANPEWRAGRIE